jgi:SAM-dependent methyltransferase
MSRTEQALLAQIRIMTRDAHYKRLVLRHCRGIDPTTAVSRFNAEIHPGDQMLIHSLREHRDAGAAFSQYFNIALQQCSAAQQILHAFFGAHANELDVLDFACGYGRLLRFLSLAIPPTRIWASDLQSDAVDFVRDAFGVHGVPSHADPHAFEPGRRFDFIWVASLFSHLPDGLFKAWLARLTALLTPRGVLCFSVRDVGLMPESAGLSASGIHYATCSENADLATDIYGTTYAGEAFVRTALQAATGDNRPYWRLHKALANEQDLYVVAADPHRDLSKLRGFRRGPWGWVDVRHLSGDGVLRLQGWAASLDDGAVECVEIEVDGAPYRCATGIPRPDVAAAFGDDRLAQSGWEFRCDLGREACEARIAASTRSARGESALLYAGSVRCAEDAAGAG